MQTTVGVACGFHDDSESSYWYNNNVRTHQSVVTSSPQVEIDMEATRCFTTQFVGAMRTATDGLNCDTVYYC